MMVQPQIYHKLTWQQRRQLRADYAEAQKGTCYLCGEFLCDDPAPKIAQAQINSALFPPNFFKYPVHLHHCHTTGLTIGAVHAKCNAYLWQFKGE